MRFSSSDETSMGARSLGKLIILCIIMIVVGIVYLYEAFDKGNNPDIYILNGLDKSYTISANGIEKNLMQMERHPLKVPEGQINIKVLDESLGIEPQTVTVKTNFFTRPFAKNVFIINPDKTAPITWEQTVYADESTEIDEDSGCMVKIYTGEQFYEFSDIDYIFEEFPESLFLSSDIEHKIRLGVYSNPDVRDKLPEIIEYYMGKEQAFEFTKDSLGFNPDNTTYLNYLIEFCEEDSSRLLKTLQPGLDARPVRVYWHCIYQDAVEKNNKGSDSDNKKLITKYSTMLKKEPGNNDLVYLAARLIDDPEVAEKEMLRATAGLKPCIRAYYSLALMCLSQGRFNEALGHLKNTPPKDEKIENIYLEVDIYNALGDYDLALKTLNENIIKNPDDWSLLLLKAKCYHLKGELTKNASTITGMLEKFGSNADKEQLERLRILMRAIFAYYDKDIAKFDQLSAKIDQPWMQFSRCLTCSKRIPDDIDKQIENPYHLLSAYVTYMSQGKPNLAKLYLRRASEQLEKQGQDERSIAASLLNKVTPDVKRLCGISMPPDDKRVVLAACGYVYPEHKDKLFALARKLNYDPSFPHILIDEVTKK